METALEVHKVLNDNLEVVDDVDGTDNEGVEAHGSVEGQVKINQASTARDKCRLPTEPCAREAGGSQGR